MKLRKLIVFILAAALTAAASGCGKTKQETGGGSGTGGEKLTYWMPLNGNVAMTSSDFGETPFAKELQKRLNVAIEFQHPPQGNQAEKFNVMMAMNDLPDIIESGWAGYPGGPGKAIKENKIIDLAVNIDGETPNFAKVLKENPTVAKLAKTDGGEIFGFPFIRGDKSLQIWTGPVIRQDWLNDLGLSMPETIDEWETVLTAFKDKKGAKAPLTLMQGQFAKSMFSGAWELNDDFYLDNGKVVYGPAQPAYKDFLETMARWYKNGLLDKDVATADGKSVDANILGGNSGATAGALGSGIGRWQASAPNAEFELAGAPYPSLKKGVPATFSDTTTALPGIFAAITTSCKNPETAKRVLDYGYGNEGYMLYNFGIEGESYTMVGDYPTYTENITNNSEGLAMSAAMALYMRSCADGPFVQDKRYMEQYSNLPQQKQAWDTWVKTDGENHIIPNIYIDESVSDDIAQKRNSITTYKGEMSLAFIIGNEPLSKYGEFKAELTRRGIDSVLAEMQKAYDRYLTR